MPVATLEALLKGRLGWADGAVSPFAIASRNGEPPFKAVAGGERDPAHLRANVLIVPIG